MAAQKKDPVDLTKVSLEELASLQVTSVSKKEQSLSEVGASVYVITQDDIRRSGMANIPDLLRMVPGVDVARLDTNAWAISARGFSAPYSDTVLVLVDGRSAYSPAFSGVFWDQIDVPLEDIDRIEVIRGPGGTVWGANAMNGVINIITKSSKNTQGGLIRAGAGSKETLQGLAQYGGTVGSRGTYRVFASYANTDTSIFSNGREAADGLNRNHEGFRTDWELSPRDTATVQGDLFQAREGQTLSIPVSDHPFPMTTFNDPVTVGAGNILGRWTHTLANGSETQVQIYYDRYHRYDLGREVLDTLDADFQYHFAIGARQDVVAGAGYRFTIHDFQPDRNLVLIPSHSDNRLYSSFLQDEIKLSSTWSFIAGSKFEHNDFTGFEFEPSAQLVWTPNAHHTVWVSTARAIRQPSLFYEGSRLNQSSFALANGGFGVVQFFGTAQAKTETMLDSEAGYRTEFGRNLTLDLSAFLSQYHRLETLQPGTPSFVLDQGPPHLVTPYFWENNGRALDYGAEVSANWRVTERWRISPGLSLLHMNVKGDPSNPYELSVTSPGDSPAHQVQLRSFTNLTKRLEWDASAYFVGLLTNGPVPSYTRLDTRIGWRWGESVEASLAGQNLLAPHHLEWKPGTPVVWTAVERSVVGKITWRF